ncbi:MAG: hypothetical protein DRI65_17300 [Chloroflexota bacterium]|nr:MAG: hypothetical protein DRI65_17300 [Chloroflexota bacterium]
MKQIENNTETWELDNGLKLSGVHTKENCGGTYCVFHNPSGHHMSTWRMHWRDDKGIFERICEHGVGHPDPDQFEYWESNDMHHLKVHGCDGCCHVDS